MLNRREFLAALASTAYGAVLARALGEELLPTRPGPPWAVRPAENLPDYRRFFRTTEMIGRVTDHSAVVNLVTAENLDEGVLARVRWAGSADALPDSPQVSPTFAAGQPLSRLELPIAELQPNQDYVYRVEFASRASPQCWLTMDHLGSFSSQKTSGRSFSFCVVADPHWGEGRYVPLGGPRWWTGEQCLQRILADEPFDFMIDLGDSPQPSRTDSPTEAVARYLQYRDVMAPVTHTMPTYLVLGNHEKEAGFHQKGTDDPEPPPLWNHQSATQYRQKWSAEARLLCIPNPRGDTYPEGGEGAPGYDSLDDWLGEEGPWNDGTRSHLQNFYAWTWGDGLFIVLDPFRYTLVGSITGTNSPSQWTLGPTQLQWLEDVLAGSNATWKFILCHHQVGGGLINAPGHPIEDGGTKRAYGRGSAVEADRPGTEQAIIHNLMLQYGAQFFVYGHDHAFCHSVMDGVHYLCCGRATHLNAWWGRRGMLDSYGSIVNQGQDRPWIEALYNVLGYTKFGVTSSRVTMQWIRTGYSFRNRSTPIEQAERDWRESWVGHQYRVDSPWSVRVTMPPRDVRGVRTVAGAQVPSFFTPPPGVNYYDPPYPVISDHDSGSPPGSPGPGNSRSPAIPLADFPEPVAVVDTVPELIYEVSFEI